MTPLPARRILVVEDDDRQRQMIGLILANAGYGIVEAQSVKTALMHLDIIDLSVVVLDLRLPNGHGRKVVEQLIAKRNDVPVVILSAYPEDAPTGFPVTSVVSKLTQTKCPSCGELVPGAKCDACGLAMVKEKPFRDRLLIAVADASRTADAIRSMRETTRRPWNTEPKQ